MTRPPRPPPAVCLSAAELRRWRAHRTQDAAAAALLTPPRTYRYWELHGVTSQPKADGLRAAMRATPAASAAIRCAMVDASRVESNATLTLNAAVCACLHTAKTLRNDMLADHAKEAR